MTGFKPLDWNRDISWSVMHKSVRNNRRRIFQAKRKKEFRNLRSLQMLMLNSAANILLFIQKVCSNGGGKTPGIDGEKYTTPDQKIKLFYEIKEMGFRNYEPMPTRRIYIEENSKRRPIGIPTVKDRIMQRMVVNCLEPEWEAEFEWSSYGFRPNRSVNDAVARIYGTINKQNSRRWIVESDISKCFDSINHKLLLEKIDKSCSCKILIRKWLKCGVLINGMWYDQGEVGTPQGGCLSPLLCNIALHGLDKELGIRYSKTIRIQGSRSLIRYADDLVIMCYSKEDAITSSYYYVECYCSSNFPIYDGAN
jgi:RNA-directed DNA polymerase